MAVVLNKPINYRLPKPRRFRVLAGKHHERDKTKVGADGRIVIKTFIPGQIVESSMDLVKQHGKDKYAYAKASDVDEDYNKPESDDLGDEGEEDALEEMTVEQLRTFAAQEEIDLDGAKTKAEVIAKIRQVR